MNCYPFIFRKNTGLVFQDADAKIDIKKPTCKAFKINCPRKGLRKGLRSENMLRNINLKFSHSFVWRFALFENHGKK
jgi:hypothetical protein